MPRLLIQIYNLLISKATVVRKLRNNLYMSTCNLYKYMSDRTLIESLKLQWAFHKNLELLVYVGATSRKKNKTAGDYFKLLTVPL